MTGILLMGGASLALVLASCTYLLVRGGNLGDFLDDPAEKIEDENHGDVDGDDRIFRSWHSDRLLREVRLDNAVVEVV